MLKENTLVKGASIHGGPSLPLAAFGLAVASAILVGVAPFVLETYTINILIRACLYAAVALTVDILWGYTGILTFGQSAFFGAGAYAAALIFTNFGLDTETALAAVATAALGPALLGLFVGWLSFYQGSTPLYASVISLALPILMTQLVFAGGTFTGSSSGLVGYETFDIPVETWFWICGGSLVALTLGAWIFVNSETGRLLVAIRDNELRCAYLGLNTPKIKILLTAALAGVAGLAGFAYASFSGVAAPETTGFVFGTELIIFVALGGRGTLIGPVLGAIGIEVLSSYLSGDLPYVWKLIVGLLFVIVVIVLPQGLFAALFSFILRRFRRGRDGAPQSEPVRLPLALERGLANPSLIVSNVRKSFGSFQVLRDVSFSIQGGELVSLIGPNGAGKTTLIRCLSDGAERSGGNVDINRHELHKEPPHRIVGFGLGRKFQTASIFESLTVAECLRVARARLNPPSLWQARLPRMPSAALSVLAITGLDQALQTRARGLSHGQKQALELAMVLASEPQVVLLDEPTAGLTAGERREIGGVLQSLSSTHGLAVILVEHDLDFVRNISTRVVVLHQGAILLDGSVDEVSHSDLVKSAYEGVSHD